MGRKLEEDRSHPYLILKETPPALIELRRILSLVANIDLYQAGITGDNIGDCLGRIAAKLDIAMDGYYEIPEVCEMLVEAIGNRGKFSSQPHLRAAGLVNAELVEREGTVEIERKTDGEGPYIEGVGGSEVVGSDASNPESSEIRTSTKDSEDA